MADFKKCVASFEGSFQNVNIHFWYKNGVEEQLTISLKDFIGCLSESQMSESNYIQLGSLPKEIYDGAIDIGNVSSFRAVLVLPKGRHMLNYFGDITILPFPDLTFLFEVGNGYLKNSKVFALDRGKSQEIQADTVVCRYPFGNVYFDGRICWGTNMLPQVKNITESSLFIELFLGSETNMDLYQAPLHHPEFVNQRGLIEALEKMDTFPTEFLRPDSLLLSQLVDKFFERRN